MTLFERTYCGTTMIQFQKLNKMLNSNSELYKYQYTSKGTDNRVLDRFFKDETVKPVIDSRVLKPMEKIDCPILIK